MEFEVDTGSYLSTININDVKRIPNIVITPTRKKAKCYGNNIIDFIGETMLKFKYNKRTIHHNFLVVPDDCVSLLGRDLCSKMNLKLTIPSKNVFSLKSDLELKYRDYFANDFVSCVKEKVKLPIKTGATPVFCKPRSVPLRYKALVKEELDRLENANIISKKISSDWASPTVNVLKSNNKIRICGDYFAVNKNLEITRFPLPTIDDVINKVGNAKYFSKIDLSNAFLQVPLHDDFKKYTTINTQEGLYEYNYLPFGTSASPAIFQNFMCKILSNVKNVIIYQDDLLILAESVEKHGEILDQVLNTLKDAGIKINYEKCSFLTDKVTYLGYVFDKQGVHPDKDKIKAIIDAPKPKNVKEVQSFIGLCNFYNRFIRNFSNVFAPLNKLLRKGVTFEWKSEQEKCFTIIKKLFQTDFVLRPFDVNLPTVVETDASCYGIGAALMQKHADGHFYPVQFASRSLNPAESKYSQIEREALSIVFGCQKFKNFLFGCKFIVKNDHNPLTKLFGTSCSIPENCSARIKRWALKLSQFDFKVEYIKGSDNLNGDFLSRLPLKETSNLEEPYEIIFNVEALNKYPITCHDIKIHTDKDEVLSKIKNYIQNGFPDDLDIDLKPFKNIIHDLSVVHGCLMYHDKIYIPESIRTRVLEQFHANHPGISAMKQLTRGLIWYQGLDKDVELMCKSCKICQNSQSIPPQNNNVEWPETGKRWSRIHVDHFFFENKIFFIAVDSHSKYIECLIVKSVSTSCTIEALREIMSRQGLPELIVSDNSTSFTSAEFKDFLEKNCIVHVTPPSYSPQSNGLAERSVQTIKKLLKKNTTGSIHSRLSNVLLYYRSTPHSITKVSPNVMLNNRKLVTLKDKVHPNFVSFPKKEGKVVKSFNIGDNILALSYRPGQKWYTGVVRNIISINIYDVYIHDLNTIWRRHSNQLRLSVDPAKFAQSRKNYDVSDEFDIPVCTNNEVIPECEQSVNNSPEIDTSVETPNVDRPLPRRSSRDRKPNPRYISDPL